MVLRQVNIHMKRMNLDFYLTPYTKINSKWNKDLNKTGETIKLWDRNLGVNLFDFGVGHSFLDMTPKAQATK